ncbi:MAG: hypothetical protein ACKOBG_07880 [Actinomycetota bacterium]
MAAGTPLPDDDARPGDDLRARGRSHALEAARRDDFPTVDVEAARRAAAALAVPVAGDDIRAAAAAIEEHAHFEPDPPVEAHRKQAVYAKRIVSRLVRFSNHHVAAQVSGLGWSVAWLGRATADRIEALEREIAELRARIERSEADPGAERQP